MSGDGETLGEALARIRRDIEALPAPARWFIRRKLRSLEGDLAARRDGGLRRYFAS